MDRFGLEDSRDDSSAGSEHSAASRTNRATPFVRLSSIPSMYSPASKSPNRLRLDDSDDDDSDDDASGRAANDGAIDRDRLPVPDEIKDLFEFLDAYEPVELDLETPLRCFLPPRYFVAVGDVDPIVKIPRPDGVPDGIGTSVLDEPVPAHQSNAAAIELRLRNRTEGGTGGAAAAVRSIDDAAENSDEIDGWIGSVEEVRAARPPLEVRHRNEMPGVQELMRAWPKEIEDELRNGTLELPSADIDLNVKEYALMVCSLLGIPVYEGCVVESVHVMLRLFAELQDSNDNIYA